MTRSVARFPLGQRTWSPLIMSVLAVSAAIAHTPTENDIHARRPSWSETLLATRTNYLHWASQRAEGPTADGPSTASVVLTGDASAQPLVIDLTQQPWLRLNTVCEEGVGNCHVWGDAVLVDREGREVPLSQLEPFSISVGWGRLHRNENWQGEPLRIGDRTFEHGIWVHADSDVSYALSGKYVRFAAHVGMDAARPKGRARFTVSCDAPALLPAIWQRIATDFPRQSQWFERDLHGRHLDWLAGSPDVPVRDAIERAAGQLGPFRSLTLAALHQLAAGGPEPDARTSAACAADRASATRCWISTRSCSSSGIARCSTTCATSTTASPRRRAAGCTCWSDAFGRRIRRSATCWPIRSSSTGRLAGQRLSGGRARRPPCVTTGWAIGTARTPGRIVPLAGSVYDGGQILFAYVENRATRSIATTPIPRRATGTKDAATTSSRSTSTAAGWSN
jgi:hypothetical protein